MATAAGAAFLGRPLSGAAARGLPAAWVLGDINLVTALGYAGIRSVLVAPEPDVAVRSRYVLRHLGKPDHWHQPDELVTHLLDDVRGLPDRPPLLYQTDGDLLLVSRYRRELTAGFHFVVAAPDVVEDMVDKERFALRAEQVGLPVPRSQVIETDGFGAEVRLRFPLIVKPLLRRDLAAVGLAGAKALRVPDRGHLDDLRRQLAPSRIRLLAQELVPGPESRMESYHAYVDAGGAVVAEFTGAKVRTSPAEYGETTALRITDAADVRRQGRQVLDKLRVTGVVKVDFKRDPAGRLVLLEVNPRFNLWHLAAARAGLNLPAVVCADLLGAPRPRVGPARPGVTWCDPLEDRHAHGHERWPALGWLSAVLSADVRSVGSARDPGPLLRGAIWPALQRRAEQVRRRSA